MEELYDKDIKIPESFIEKWQKIVDIMGEMMNVTASLIMKADPPYIEVFRASQNEGNPYEVGEREHLDGLYCEEVIKSRRKLYIADASQDEKWQNNPDIDMGMISYLGFHLEWPDGEIFGTICVLDHREKKYSNKLENLMKQFKELVESHLQIIYQNKRLNKEIKKRKRAETKLKEDNKKLSITLKSIGDAVITTDTEGCITGMNKQAQTLTGWSFKSVEGKHLKTVFNIINARTGEPVNDPAQKVLTTGHVVGLANDTTLIARDGHKRQIADSASPIIDEDDNITGVILIFRDITKKYNMQQKLKEENRWLEALFNNASYPIALVDDNNCVMKVNSEFEKVFKFNFREIVGKDLDDVINMGKDDIANRNKTEELLKGNQVELEETRYDGEGNPVECLIKGIPVFVDDQLIGGYAIYIDITERKKTENQIKYMNFHDSLTDLYNRRFLEEQICRLDVERQLPISLIMTDLNGLKLINDTYGHAAGDEALKKAADILKNVCREEDIIARWGGDEFVVLLPQTTKKDAQKVCKRIKESSTGIPVGEENQETVPLSIARGFSVKDDPSQDVFRVLKDAEDKMYKDKLLASKSTKNHILKTLLQTLQEKSMETEAHIMRMQNLALKLGKRINLSPAELDKLSLLANLHDIGKTIIPRELLTKSDQLNEREWEIIKKHPDTGYRICSASNEFSHIAQEILTHHERWDGKGYPEGLTGDDIPLLARIINIIDAFDVMTNGRHYKDAVSKEEALKELKRCAGSQFDPELVAIFIDEVEK